MLSYTSIQLSHKNMSLIDTEGSESFRHATLHKLFMIFPTYKCYSKHCQKDLSGYVIKIRS